MTSRLTTPCPPPAELLDMCRAQVRANLLAAHAPTRKIACRGAAHSYPHIDNCSLCAPNWGVVEVPLVPLDAIGYEPGPVCTHCDPTDRGCEHCVVEHDYAVRVLVGMQCPGLRGAACESGERLREGAYVLPGGERVCRACAVCACCDGDDDAEIEHVERALEKEMTK